MEIIKNISVVAFDNVTAKLSLLAAPMPIPAHATTGSSVTPWSASAPAVPAGFGTSGLTVRGLDTESGKREGGAFLAGAGNPVLGTSGFGKRDEQVLTAQRPGAYKGGIPPRGSKA